MIDRDAPISQQLLLVPVRQAVTQIPANRELITSGGNRNPAKLDLAAGTRRQRRHIHQACLILLSTDATDPYEVI
jgi:hypothetical protein